MRLPRFRLRTLMIAVAVVGAVILYGVRRNRYERKAYYHAIQWLEAGIEEAKANSSADAERLQRKGRWHYRLSEEFQCAARFPWYSAPSEASPPQ